ncbi:hypothetical protein DENSPDRAFT_338610 [Dentipellis sp. KUC8613]|nr:hypothetical protein DENSPDRAFT_338610 [Dentipellis sp. KUC8613]
MVYERASLENAREDMLRAAFSHWARGSCVCGGARAACRAISVLTVVSGHCIAHRGARGALAVRARSSRRWTLHLDLQCAPATRADAAGRSAPMSISMSIFCTYLRRSALCSDVSASAGEPGENRAGQRAGARLPYAHSARAQSGFAVPSSHPPCPCPCPCPGGLGLRCICLVRRP